MPTKPVRIAIRTLLVAALVLTAHLIRPFSFGNIAGHMLHSASSFSFVLPGQTRDSFNSANLLAISLTNLFFTDGLRGEWNVAQPSEQPLLAASVTAASEEAQTVSLPLANEATCPTRQANVARLKHRPARVAFNLEEAAEAEVAVLSESEEAAADTAPTVGEADLGADVAVAPETVAFPEAHAVVALTPISFQPALACAPKAPSHLDGKAIQTRIEALMKRRSELDAANQAAFVALINHLQAVESARVLRLTPKPATSTAKCTTEEKPAEIETEASEAQQAPAVEETQDEIESKQEGLVMPQGDPFANKCAVKADWP